MNRSKSSASSIVLPSIVVIHVMNGAQFLNATGVGSLCAVMMLSPITKI